MSLHPATDLYGRLHYHSHHGQVRTTLYSLGVLIGERWGEGGEGGEGGRCTISFLESDLDVLLLRTNGHSSNFVNTSLRFFYGHFVGECHVLITVMRDEGCVKTSKRR